MEKSFNLSDFLSEVNKIDDYLKVLDLIFSNETNYKKTPFYKQHKIKLKDLVFESKKWYLYQSLSFAGIQRLINNLDLSNLEFLLDKMGSMFEQENEQTIDDLKKMQEISKLLLKGKENAQNL